MGSSFALGQATGLAQTECADRIPGTPEVSAALELRPGATIDKYRLLEPLGAGGMGVVYEAFDTRLSRRVAIKFVASHDGKSRVADEERRRLLREARAMARLDHPNVVTIYETGACDGHVYVAMELLEGGSLRDRLNDWHSGAAPLPWRAILDTFLLAGEGLAVAHDAGLVHRDCKPDNILIGKDGRVAVADFGIVGNNRDLSTKSAATALTTFGEVAGTPAYMAPEQYAGEQVDWRADQFAFCASLYEALYGQLPFAGDTRDSYQAAAAAGAIRRPPASSNVPMWVFESLRRGLSPNPESRFRSMRDLLHAFSQQALRLEPRRHLFAHYMIAIVIATLGIVGMGPAEYGRMALDHLIGGGFMVFTVILRRRTLMSTQFNRRVISLLGIGIAVNLAILGATYRLGIDADATRALFPLMWTIMTAAAAVFDRRMFVPLPVFFAFAAITIAWPSLAPATMAACISALVFLLPHANWIERCLSARIDLIPSCDCGLSTNRRLPVTSRALLDSGSQPES